MHYFAALVSLAALILYADRTGWLFLRGTQTSWALVTRAGVALWMLSNVVAFLDLATAGAPFVWRHWFVLAAMSLTVAGHLGLGVRTRSRTSPT